MSITKDDVEVLPKNIPNFNEGIIVDAEIVKPIKNELEITFSNEFVEKTGKQTLLIPTPKKPKTRIKKQYTQRKKRNWRLYNYASTKEFGLVLKLTDNLIRFLGIKTYGYKTGRPPVQMRDMVFSCILKIYLEKSIRTSEGIVEELLFSKKYISKKAHYNTVINYMNNPEMTKYLYKIIKETASIMSPFEDSISIDGTGISTFTKKHWVDDRLNEKEFKKYKKLQLISGNKTHIILSAGVFDGETSEKDKKHFEKLLNNMPNNFVVKEMMGDGAYYVGDFAEIVKARNIEPYFKPPKNASTKTQAGVELRKMVRKWKRFKDAWNPEYHKRSNIESSINSMKSKFLYYARSKKDIALKNEILCKVICHNLSVIIRGIYERNIDISYLD